MRGRTATAPDGATIADQDHKRRSWLLSVVWPLVPFIGSAAHHASGHEAALAIPLLISDGLMPLLDARIGEDTNNPPEAVVRQRDADRCDRWLTWAAVPLHVVAGTDAGLGLNTAQALGHKHNRLEQWLARLVLAVPACGHFTVEHGRGHAAGWPRPTTTPVHAWASRSTSLRCATCPGPGSG